MASETTKSPRCLENRDVKLTDGKQGNDDTALNSHAHYLAGKIVASARQLQFFPRPSTNDTDAFGTFCMIPGP